ncbi:protein translocase subunit SecD [Novispirillum sp. DQ9]|uniref:protein translocase subunit SecD n=1 Tax=Novispirillum sp. DQ9 TaxID=3398612 RepID=UPI003C7E0A28
MLYFSRIKTTLIWVVCLLGLWLSLPNFIKPGTLPEWLPQPRFTLGLDLQGGAHLLLQVDTDVLLNDRLKAVEESVRTQLREARLRYTGLQARDGAVRFTLADATQADAVRTLLAPVLKGTSGLSDFDVAVDGAAFSLTLREAAVAEMRSNAVAQSIEIVRRRIDETGVNEPLIARQGEERIVVQLPGLDDPGRIKRLIGQTAKMTFHMVEPDTQPRPGVRVLPLADGNGGGASIAVREKVELDGGRLTSAHAGSDSRTGAWVVNFAFDSLGTRRFAEISTANVGKPFAIVLDGKVISAPVIREPITGGQGQISGSFTAQSASDLAVLLRAGALPAPLTVVEERTVGPDLGADAIQAGLVACVVGFVLVVGYMTVTYGLFGVFANVALTFNLLLTLAALSLLGATLTLPGIAGILLTLGMSVDANILINERIREEVRRGAKPAAAIEAGFRRAFATITDSNLTTLIKMVLLYIVGTGTVKGFAVTISLGILTSMFTATVVCRWLVVAWLRRKRPKALPPDTRLRLLPGVTGFSFMKARHWGIGMSVALSLASVGLFFAPGLNYGVDFAGGTVIEARTAQAPDFDALRAALAPLDLGQVTLQQFGGDTDVMIRLERQPGDDGAQQVAVKAVQDTLAKEFPGTTIRKVDSVGASVSGELFESGMMALGLAVVAMLVYITFRFEWQFGVGAVVTMLLDVTKTIGFFAITGLQFDLTALAAILTIMGYSINDKVVVYDRIRENLRLYKAMPLRELIDRSINETMSRTIGTTAALFLATLPLALFAGEGLREFGWILLFGAVLATSSSIFIAAPILLYLGEGRLRRPSDSTSPDDSSPHEPLSPAEARMP